MATDQRLLAAARLQGLEDRQAIQDIENRYADGIRLKDPQVIASCFTEDAVVKQHIGQEPWRGREEIRAYFSGSNPTGPRGARPGEKIDRWVGTTPVLANFRIELDGDSAHCECTCVVFRVGYQKEAGIASVRYFRNIDDLLRTREGWRISQRVHLPFWEFDVPASPKADGWDYPS